MRKGHHRREPLDELIPPEYPFCARSSYAQYACSTAPHAQIPTMPFTHSGTIPPAPKADIEGRTWTCESDRVWQFERGAIRKTMSPSWKYPPTPQIRVQGRGLAEDNFAQETKSNVEILIREALQNPLDASDGSGAPVRVSFRHLQGGDLDKLYLGTLIDDEYRERLEASTGIPFNGTPVSALVIEDYGTTGLLGTYEDTTVDGPRENWNAFWFREGEGAKAGKSSNGRAGQGKVTFYRIGAARAVFALTTRADGKSLLMGRSSFRRMYTYQKTKFERDAFWCITMRDLVLPATETMSLNAFREAFRLQRQNEPGLSIVVPYPEEEFDARKAVQTVIADFYYPIASGRLEVQIGETIIDSAVLDTIADKYFPDETALAERSSFTKAYRAFVREVIEDDKALKRPIALELGWDKSTAIQENAFPDGALEPLRKSVEEGRKVAIRCPVKVQPRNGTAISTYFDVHLQVPEELDHIEEVYIRGDLIIGDESHLTKMPHLPKARGLVLAEEPDISRFLAEAEEPTHLKWNASRPRLKEEYISPQNGVRAVRQALPRLLTILSGSISKRDVKALAKFFTRPSEELTSRKGGAGKKGKTTGETPEVAPLPPPQARPFRLTTDSTSVSVIPNGSFRLPQEKLPVSCALEVAYEGLDDDPFAEYDPFDFDLGSEELHQTFVQGIVIVARQWNRLEFEVQDPHFFLSVGGFDPHIRLRARLNFMENHNEPNIDTQ